MFLYPRARETALPEPRSGFDRAAAFFFYEFGLGANDGDVGGGGTRYGADVTTPRSPHPPPRYSCLCALCGNRFWNGSNLTMFLYPRARETALPEPRSGLSNNRKQGDCWPIALGQASSMKSPIPKERLRVSNWIVPRLYYYAVYETV